LSRDGEPARPAPRACRASRRGRARHASARHTHGGTATEGTAQRQHQQRKRRATSTGAAAVCAAAGRAPAGPHPHIAHRLHLRGALAGPRPRGRRGAGAELRERRRRRGAAGRRRWGASHRGSPGSLTLTLSSQRGRRGKGRRQAAEHRVRRAAGGGAAARLRAAGVHGACGAVISGAAAVVGVGCGGLVALRLCACVCVCACACAILAGGALPMHLTVHCATDRWPQHAQRSCGAFFPALMQRADRGACSCCHLHAAAPRLHSMQHHLLTQQHTPPPLPRNRQAYKRNARERPAFMLLPPLLTFCVLCALSLAGVILGANQYESESRSRAASTALDWVRCVSVWSTGGRVGYGWHAQLMCCSCSVKGGGASGASGSCASAERPVPLLAGVRRQQALPWTQDTHPNHPTNTLHCITHA